MARLFLALLLVATSGLAGQLENARLLTDSGRFDDARQTLEQARREPRLEGEALIMLTEICNAEEDFKCGIEHGNKAVVALPNSADAHYQYAVALRIKMSEVSKVKAMFALKPYKKELGQPAKARAAYEEALRLDPDSDEVKKDLKSLRTKGG